MYVNFFLDIFGMYRAQIFCLAFCLLFMLIEAVFKTVELNQIVTHSSICGLVTLVLFICLQ